MPLIEFAVIEKSLLQLLAENRLVRWRQQEISDSGCRKRFAASYLKPLQSALCKIEAGNPTLYRPMEKAILVGCIKEWSDLRKGNSSNEFNISNYKILLEKLQSPKSK